MAKKQKTKKYVKKKRDWRLPFTKKNYQIFFIGIITLIVGYIFLSIGPEDSFYTRTLGPIVLFFGYCVIIPLSILYREKTREEVKGD